MGRPEGVSEGEHVPRVVRPAVGTGSSHLALAPPAQVERHDGVRVDQAFGEEVEAAQVGREARDTKYLESPLPRRSAWMRPEGGR